MTKHHFLLNCGSNCSTSLNHIHLMSSGVNKTLPYSSQSWVHLTKMARKIYNYFFGHTKNQSATMIDEWKWLSMIWLNSTLTLVSCFFFLSNFFFFGKLLQMVLVIFLLEIRAPKQYNSLCLSVHFVWFMFYVIIVLFPFSWFIKINTIHFNYFQNNYYNK